MKSNKNKRKYILISLILLLEMIVLKSDIIKKIDQKYEKYQLNRIERIVIKDISLDGNTESNINNYGLVAETKDSIFYTQETYLYRTDRNFSNQIVLNSRGGGIGKNTINVVDDWVFFRQGKEIKRMKNDGSNIDRIFKGYSLHMHVVGNWIYFINVSDDSKIYKMDVNGQNREILCDKDINDMAIYDDKIYYSYEYNKESFLGVMNLDGTGKQLLSNIKTRNMIVDKGYIYYLNDVDEKLYRIELKNNLIEELSDKKILKFCKDDNWIFYTLKAPKDSDWRFKGLYRMDIDGSNVLALDREIYLDELGIGITEDWIFYVSTNGTDYPRLKRIKKDGTSVIDIESNK